MIVNHQTETDQKRVELLKRADVIARLMQKRYSAWLCWVDLPPNEFKRKPPYLPEMLGLQTELNSIAKELIKLENLERQ